MFYEDLKRKPVCFSPGFSVQKEIAFFCNGFPC